MDIEALHAYADHLAANMPPITDEQSEMAARILATVISERA